MPKPRTVRGAVSVTFPQNPLGELATRCSAQIEVCREFDAASAEDAVAKAKASMVSQNKTVQKPGSLRVSDGSQSITLHTAGGRAKLRDLRMRPSFLCAERICPAYQVSHVWPSAAKRQQTRVLRRF